MRYDSFWYYNRVSRVKYEQMSSITD